MKWYDIRFWKWACICLVVGVVLLAFTGCKTKEYVKVPEYHTEYIVRSDTIAKMDSVYVKDSVYVYQKGDTVVIRKIAYRDRYRNICKVKLDTIFKRDSVSVPVPVERQLTKSEMRLMTLGRCYIGFLFLLAVCAIGFAFWYHNKKC